MEWSRRQNRRKTVHVKATKHAVQSWDVPEITRSQNEVLLRDFPEWIYDLLTEYSI